MCACLQPPLPDEDYPQEEDAAGEDREEELLAVGLPTLHNEYMLSHVTRTVIPRASLDRSAPPGWNLSVDPSGTWIFSSDHSPEQVGGAWSWWAEVVELHWATVGLSNPDQKPPPHQLVVFFCPFLLLLSFGRTSHSDISMTTRCLLCCSGSSLWMSGGGATTT